jgi:hypothetical protein
MIRDVSQEPQLVRLCDRPPGTEHLVPERETVPGVYINEVHGFSGPATGVDLDSSTFTQVISNVRRLQMVADGRVQLYHGVRFIAEIPAGKYIELISCRAIPITIRAEIGTGFHTTGLAALDLVDPGTIFAGAGTHVGSWITPPDGASLEFGQVIFQLSGLVETGTWRLEAQALPTVGTLALTADQALADTPAGAIELRSFTSESLRQVALQRRVSVDLAGAAPSIIFDRCAMVWMPRESTIADGLTDPTTVTVQIYTDGLFQS